jgi:hypothetical protein
MNPRHAVAVVFTFLLSVAGAGWAGEGGARVVDRTKVYYGLPDSFSSPAVIECSKVMDTLPAMKTIDGEGVKKNSARWFLLVNEANQQLHKALKSVGKDQGYDLFAEVGAVTSGQTVPNATDAVIKAAEKTN